MANEYYIINPNSIDERQKRENQIFEFLKDKQFYCAVAYAKVCKLREDEYNKNNNTKEDYFNKLYTLLAYAFDDPWYGAKAYDNFDFKKKKIEDKDFSSFKDNNFIKLSFLAIAIKVLYCQNFGNFEISNDSYYKQLKLENVIEDIVNFRKETGKFLAVYADKKQIFKNRKNDIDSIENEQDNLENERKRFSIGNTELENILREDIFSDTNSLAYSFYKKAIKDKKQDFLLEDDNEYLKKFLDDDDYYNNLDLTISFDKIQDFVKERYNKKLKNLKNVKDFQNSDQYNTVSYDLEKFLKDVMNFLDKCVNDLSNTYEDKADKKYNKEWSSYVEHLENTLDKLEEDIKLKSDNKEIAGICIIKYLLEYIKDSISMDTKEEDYSYEYSTYFYVPFLLSNHVMLNDDFCPDFPILYDAKLREQKFLNFFVESIQPEYRIINHAGEWKNFDYTISNLKQELGFKQKKKNNNKYNYYSKDLIAKYDSSCKLNESEREKSIQKEKAENNLYSFQGDLELALWYRQLEESLQSKEELDKKSENNAYKLYLHIRKNIEEWYNILCEKSNYDFFNKIVGEYSKCIKEKINKLKIASLDKFKEFNNEKKSSCKEKAFFEEFYRLVKEKVELKDNVTFDEIVEHFEDKYKKQEEPSKDEYKNIRAFFEAFYNIVFRQQNFSRFFIFLKNFQESSSCWNKLNFGNLNLDDYLFKFTDEQKYNDSLRDADSDDEISLKDKVVLGNGCKSIESAQKLAECWDNIFLPNKNKVDIKTNFKDFLENLGFGINTIKEDSKIQFVYDDEKLEFLNNCTVKLLPKIFKHPIAAFGSDAVDKEFRIVSIDRDKISDLNIVDFLINFIKNLGTESHTIILFDYALTLPDRRNLAKRIKTEINSNGTIKILFLIIDRVLITFLMKYYKAEIINEMLLSIASPFGFFQPYISSDGVGVTDAITLNEMFIGRKDELIKIKDFEVPINIVYGGRQLGKSSLLTKVTKDINENKNNARAVYVNLEDINRSNSDIDFAVVDNLVLNKIVEKMKNDQIFKDDVKINDWNDFKEEVKEVMKSDEISYLVLLIDEVDIFFKSCANAWANNKENSMKIFSEIVRFAKDYQKKFTVEKKFKVVFAGLNMIKDYDFLTGDNGLLGQIDNDRTQDGEYYIPILPFNDEDARKLIEIPLRYLGLYFLQDPKSDFDSDPESLIYLIFDKTNYYPCLIQLYCEKLLKAMCKDNYAHYDDKISPVYYVTTEHIKDIISDKGFRDTVTKKFEITLDLSPTDSKADHTYRYLATILAYLCYNGVEGYSSYKIEDFVKVAKDYEIKHICDLYNQNKLELYMDHLIELSVFSREYVEEENKTVKKYGFRRLPLWQLMGEKDNIDKELLSFSLND